MKTLGEVLTLASQFLKERQHIRARRAAEELIAHLLKLKRLDLYMQFDRPMVEGELEELRALLKRAAKGEPFEYLTGEMFFYHCALAITSDVLIPRPETEILVDIACKQLQKEDLVGKTAWDLCTGSGCIGIAVKKACPELQVVLSDISNAALGVAAANAQRNGVEVELLLGDFLEPFGSRKADFVFCNPPYISKNQYNGLDGSVKNFEPKQALVAEEEGLSFYRRLKDALPQHLHPGAKIYLELGAGQGQDLIQLFSGPEWRKAYLEKDWAGHDRFFFLEFE